MNEIFDIRRFGALAVKFYRENMKINLILMAVMVVATFLWVCKFEPFQTTYTCVTTEIEKTSLLASYKNMYAADFWGMFAAFSVFVASRAFIDVTSRSRATSALLLPASSFEKYLLVVLHSTVVLLIVYLPIFYATATMAGHNRYVLTEAVFVENPNPEKDSSLPHQMLITDSEKDAIYPSVGNVFSTTLDFFSPKNPDNEPIPYFLRWNMLAILWMFVVGIFLWGSITFRKRTMLLTALMHALVFLSVGWTIYLIGDELFKSNWGESKLHDLYFWPITQVNISSLSPWWLTLFYIFPLAYFSITWYKFKNKQV